MSEMIKMADQSIPELRPVVTCGNFYVYALIRDPRDHRDGALPFYIGKGQGNRCYNHFKPSSLSRDAEKAKAHVILRHQKNGWNVDVQILSSGMLESEALAMEIAEIAFWGRRNIGTGILHNLTDGGDGTTGRVASADERKAIAAATANWWKTATDEQKANSLSALSDYWKNASEEDKIERMSYLKIGHQWWQTATEEEKTERRLRMEKIQQQRWENATEEEKASWIAGCWGGTEGRSKSATKMWKDMTPEKMETRSAAISAGLVNNWKTVSLEERQARSAKRLETMGPEGRRNAAIKGHETLGPEGHKRAAAKRYETMGPEGFSAASRLAWEGISPERRSEIANKRDEAMGFEGRSARAKAVCESLGVEGLSARSKAINESLGKEGRSERAKKSAASRKANRMAALSATQESLI